MRLANRQPPSNWSERAVTQEILCGLEAHSLPATDEGRRSGAEQSRAEQSRAERSWQMATLSGLLTVFALFSHASSWGIFLQLLIDFSQGPSHFCTVITVQRQVARLCQTLFSASQRLICPDTNNAFLCQLLREKKKSKKKKQKKSCTFVLLHPSTTTLSTTHSHSLLWMANLLQGASLLNHVSHCLNYQLSLSFLWFLFRQCWGRLNRFPQRIDVLIWLSSHHAMDHFSVALKTVASLRCLRVWMTSAVFHLSPEFTGTYLPWYLP